MKKSTIVICFMITWLNSHAQSFAINTDGSSANASALLDVKSTAKGILIPRMTKIQRNSIASPATGLMIFQTGPDSIGFHYYTGSSWSWVTSSSNGSDWRLAGNAGTDTAVNFIGTTDNMPLKFKMNNQQAGLLASDKILLGINAGKVTGTDKGIIAIGNAAMQLANGIDDMVAIGDSALYHNNIGGFGGFDGIWNTAVGSQSLLANTKGYGNTGLGYHTLYSNTTGEGNTAIGVQTLLYNTTGESNTALGAVALKNNTTGFYNTAIGNGALFTNTAGYYNTAVGFDALLDNTSTENTATGFYSLTFNTTGYGNTANGFRSLQSNVTGLLNTGIGFSTLNRNISGSFNTAVGDSADVLVNNLMNATAIGAHAAVACNNCLVLGSVSGVNGATSSVTVGIGTIAPAYTLEVNGTTQTDQLKVGTGTPINNIQSGTFTVGSSASGFATATLTFPTSFFAIPRVIATARNQAATNYGDTFAVTLRSVSSTAVTFNIQRVDTNAAWAQTLEIDWIALQ